MNAIFVSRHRLAENKSVAICDVDGCIRFWGRRGTLFGGLVGSIIGAIFVANAFGSGGLTFGIAGTLIVCALECAAVAGGFAVFMAAFYGRGVLCGSATGLELIIPAGRSPAMRTHEPVLDSDGVPCPDSDKDYGLAMRMG